MTISVEQGPRSPHHLVVPVMDYESPSSRIHGFQELIKRGLPPPTPMHIIGDEVYRRYQNNHGKLDFESKMELTSVFHEIKEANPTREVYIGRAFYVPGIDNPNGPRTAGIKDETTFLDMVSKFYSFVERYKYHTEKGSDIALITHPFINVTDERLMYGNMVLDKDRLPWSGGYIVPDSVPGAINRIKVVATFGADEAVTSCPNDVFIIDPDRKSIIKKEVAMKTHTLVPGGGDVYKQVGVSKKFQLEQALTDEELLAIAEQTRGVLRDNKRVEFILQQEGAFYREIAPWEPLASKDLLRLDPGEEAMGPIVRIKTADDINRIRGKQAIVYFGPETFQSRTTDLFVQAAYTQDETNLVALVYGSLETSHMARILVDAGHSIILVKDKQYNDGAPVRIGRSPDGSPCVELLNPYEDAVIPFQDTDQLYKGEAGMKVARLSTMRDRGIPVPDGFGLKSEAVWKYLEDIEVMQDVIALDSLDIHMPKKMDPILDRIHKKITESPFPPELETAINASLFKFGFTSWAIRSSGNEDGENQSLAGLYSSAVNKTNKEVIPSIKDTIASYFSRGSVIAVRRGGGKPSHMVIGVGVHEFIPDSFGTIGMVVFSKNDLINIEGAHGSPEGIVSGTAKDFCRIVLERTNGNGIFVIKEQTDVEQFNLSKEMIFQVGTMVLDIEKIFGQHQDVELLITPDRGIVVVQARPL